VDCKVDVSFGPAMHSNFNKSPSENMDLKRFLRCLLSTG